MLLKLKTLQVAQWFGDVKCEKELPSKQQEARKLAQQKYPPVTNVQDYEKDTRLEKAFKLLSTVKLEPFMFRSEPTFCHWSKRAQMPPVYEFLHLYRQFDSASTDFVFLRTEQKVSGCAMKCVWECFSDKMYFFGLAGIFQTYASWFEDSWTEVTGVLNMLDMVMDLIPIVCEYLLMPRREWENLTKDLIYKGTKMLYKLL